MNKYKKILSGLLLSSFILGNFSFSYANNDSLLTKDEKIKIEAEILKLQSRVFTYSKKYLEIFFQEFNKFTSYEENGNSKIEFLVDQNMFGKADMSFDLKDYKIKNKNLDTDVSGNISLKVNYFPVYSSGFELDVSTFTSFISKESEAYTLLKDLDFKVNNENISQILTLLQTEFKDNKYIKLPTEQNSQKILEMIQKFNPNSIVNEAEEILSKPLLQAYKKSGDKYLLVPTKYACDTYFQLEQKFNFLERWYTPKTCSQSTYKSFVKEFIEIGELYITLGDKKTLGFYSKVDGAIFDFTLIYDEDSISKIDAVVTSTQKQYQNEGFNFHFKSGEYFKIILKTQKGENFLKLDSEIDQNNNFVEVNSTIKSKDFNGNLTLKDKKISGFYIIKQRGYDYTSQNFEYKLKNVYGIKITGNTSIKNTLEKLNLQFAGVDIKAKKAIFNGKTSYDKGNFAVRFSTKSDYVNFNFQGSGFIDNKHFKMNSTFDGMGIYTGKFDILLDTRENKNNVNIDFTLNDSKKDFFKLKLINNGTRVYKDDIKIDIPSDFKEFNPTIFQKMNSY